ncbi:MAG: ABC transporter ATP-binding protein/permease [Spirochaetota bacterium]|jgi:ATP-binding cassette subfamily B protein|nr:ABC transporter ATP-binding protein/permease [Spirochaetota bacterium]
MTAIRPSGVTARKDSIVAIATNSIGTERPCSSLADFARKYVFPLWFWYLGGAVFLTITNAIVLLLPRLARDLVNALTDTAPDVPEVFAAVGEIVPALSEPGVSGALAQGWTSIPLAIIALGCLLIVARVLSRILFFWPGRRVEAEARLDLFGRIMRAPREILYRFGQGDLVSRIANDTGYLRILFAFGMLSVANVILLLAMTIGAMLSFHAGLTLCALLPFIPIVFLIRALLPKIHAASMQNQTAIGSLSAVMTESFRGIASIRLHTARAAFLERIDDANEEVYRSFRRLALLQTIVIPLAGISVRIAQTIVLAYGGAEVIAGRLQAGDIMVFNVYMASLAVPLAFGGGIIALIERARSAHARIADIFAFPEETGCRGAEQRGTQSSAPQILTVSSLSREFRSEKTNFKIDDVSFSVAEQTVLGIAGAIGSGKSLLFDLITRFEEPPEGSIFFQGRDVLAWEPAHLRRKIGYALQTARFFSDSIRANMVFGLEKAFSDEEIYHALYRAAIADEVRGFTDGLDTITGEKGMRLSGGQRQRLALARLFLREPELLLLDDIFSAVDQKTEKRLIDAVLALRKTIIVASHRPSVLGNCDEVLLFSGGRILDRGSYAELEARRPHFDRGGDDG